ncbi:MAG: Choline-sulfatase [Labilithrix sp.]|nr:Choline-sulfatase [Labilithrix sp.]
MIPARAIVPRVFAALVALLAGVVAWKVGGGAEGPAPPPRPGTFTTAASASAPTKPGDGYEVSVRLIEVAKDARFDMPEPAGLRAVMKAHWRQQKPPFFPVTGDAARFVTTIALRTSASERQWAMAVGKEGKSWAPEARVWNMNEGSFDQRESLVSTTPGSIAFRVNVPQGAKLTFAEGTVNATDAATVFVVSVVDGRGKRHDIYRHALEPSGARRWTDASCDLSAFAGQDVELRLSTETAKATEPEDQRTGRSRGPAPPASAYSGPGNGKPTLDGGVIREDVLATPSAAVALWGNPTLLARTTPRAPYNVLWIVVDALRPDVLASFHDDAEDAAKEAAPWPPLEALLPKVPGVTPEIDDLARRGVRFTQAYSAGSWTRPGTLAMLSGARSTDLGIDTTEWIVTPSQATHFYTSDPPLLSLALRRQNMTTRAFVNNYFMVGYAPVGIEMGFERVADHRYQTRDTLEITNDATQWIKENKDTRFFAFVNYNSPHEPYEPPARHLERVPPPPAGPKDSIARLYMAEAAKDDEAIGVLMRTLDETGLRDKTIVIVTSDHGETMSSAHSGTSGLDKMPIRYHHAASNFEETTHVPIVLVAPGLTANSEVKARVRSTDIAPTILDLLRVEPHPKMTGKSLLPLAKGQAEGDERVVVSEGRGSRSILHGRWRLVVREGAARIVIQDDKMRESETELFDLETDPGERRDLAPKHPEIVAEMKARLEAALKNVAVAGAGRSPPPSPASSTPQADALKPPTLHLRFAGGAAPRRVSGTLRVGDAKSKPRSFEVSPVELGRDAFHIDGGKIDVALRTSPAAPVGFDIVIDPPATPVTWELWLDDKPWPDEGVFGGPFGLLAPSLRKGIASDEVRLLAQSTAMPTIDARRDVGLFVVRERRSDAEAEAARESTDEGAEEMARLLREWGYAHGSGATTGR